MRAAAFVVLSVLSLAACNPSAPAGDAGQSADGSGGAFPNLTNAAYRAEGTISHEGRSMPIVMIRSGGKMRMEVSTPEGQSIIVNNGADGESFVLANAGGRTVAMRTTAATQQFQDPASTWMGEFAATYTGPCSGAGQTGSEWTRTEADVVKVVCVTQDGIMLKLTDDGQTVWETTNVERGPQDPALFELPPGVQVMDLGNIPGMAEAMERVKAARGGQ